MASRSELAQYGRVLLPATIPCGQCKIPKKREQYSDNRIKDLQKFIIQCKEKKKAFDPKTDGFSRCSLCVGGPAVEHECYYCEITLPLSYFSKNMLKKNRDEALCWDCSERQQNDVISSDEGKSDSGDSGDSYNSDSTFVTNPYEGAYEGSTLSGFTPASRGNGLSSGDHSSGGVTLNGHHAPSAGANTIYVPPTGSASGSTLRATTSPSASRTVNTLASSLAGTSLSGTPSRTPTSGGRSNGFNANAYGNPRRRSPTSTVASTASATSGGKFAKVKSGNRKITSDAALAQQKDMARRAAAQKADDELCVSEESE